MIKLLSTILLLTFAATGLSSESIDGKVVILKNVTVTTCGVQLMGCSSQIILDDHSNYLLDTSSMKNFLNINGHLIAQDSKKINVSEIVGVVSKETGFFPNPTATFDVIRVLSFKK